MHYITDDKGELELINPYANEEERIFNRPNYLEREAILRHIGLHYLFKAFREYDPEWLKQIIEELSKEGVLPK